MKKCRFIKEWDGYPKGFIITPPATLRAFLLRGGIVELVEDDQVEEPVEEVKEEPKKPVKKRGRKPKKQE